MSIADHMSAMSGDSPMKKEPMEHGEGGGVHEHLKALHSQMGGKHMHVHSDGNSHTTHHIGEDGKAEGPHEHESTEALKEHVGRFMDDEKDCSGGSHEGGHEGLI